MTALRKRTSSTVDAGLPAIDAPDPGPAGFAGSLIVAEFESLAAAKAWVAADPYVVEGVYEHVDVQPFLKTRP